MGQSKKQRANTMGAYKYIEELWLQGQAGRRRLQDESKKGRKEEARAQGNRLRKACQPGDHQAEAQEERPGQSRGEGRKKVRRPPRSQLLLGERGLDLQVL